MAEELLPLLFKLHWHRTAAAIGYADRMSVPFRSYAAFAVTRTRRPEQDNHPETVTPAPPVTDPDPSALTCPGSAVGPCTTCQRQTHRYGSGGSPLCQWCMAPVQNK